MDEIVATPLRLGLSEQIVTSLRKGFAQFPSVEKVLVYGSRASGAFRHYSDIDLAVLAPAMADSDFSRLWTALDDLSILFKLDVVHLDQLTNAALKRNILTEGQPLYP